MRRYRARLKARAARNVIVAAHLGLVVSIARGVHRSVPDVFALDDLIAEGNLALIKAASQYDPAAHDGTPFSAFARQAIRGAMIESCRRKRWKDAAMPSTDAGDCSDERMSRSGISKNESEAARGIRLMAVQPAYDSSIDNARLDHRIIDAISWLPAPERELMTTLYYSDDEPTLREAARQLEMTVTQAAEMRDRALAVVRARLLPGSPIPRVNLPKAS